MKRRICLLQINTDTGIGGKGICFIFSRVIFRAIFADQICILTWRVFLCQLKYVNKSAKTDRREKGKMYMNKKQKKRKNDFRNQERYIKKWESCKIFINFLHILFFRANIMHVHV